ncbi:hypothetical protein GOZ83_19595 [Agrobacterium vitis]|nr:hypothetical protein [Agrobacterium vitis]MVA47262.1 hypothetical protein [Agrobacterium vitis]
MSSATIFADGFPWILLLPFSVAVLLLIIMPPAPPKGPNPFLYPGPYDRP